MRYFKYAALIVLIAAVGFFLGRIGAEPASAPTAPTNEVVTEIPAPPKAEPYLPTNQAAEPDQSLVLEVPAEGAQLSSQSFDVAGRAKRTSTPVAITVKDAAGATLATATAAVIVQQGQVFGRFGAAIELPAKYVGKATVEAVWTPDGGGAVQRATRNVTFVDKKSATVSVFFTRDDAPDGKECETVYARQRDVTVAASVYRTTLEALLAGPTSEEKSAGYSTSIPSGVKVLSIAVDASGTAKADFSGALDEGVAGSCRVGSIRKQIEATLLQFPEVRAVVIAVEGDVDEALQP